MDELWKDIEGYEGVYAVSNLGRVKRLNNNKVKTARCPKGRYAKVTLYKNNKGFTEYVHRLVAKAFIANPKNLPEVNHKDSDKSNNWSYNLEWSTALDNSKHSLINGTTPTGEKHYNAKLSNDDVINIRYYLNQGYSNAYLARKYDVSFGTISKIKLNSRRNNDKN